MDFPAVAAYFHKQEEPARSTLVWLRAHIKAQHPELTEAVRYGMPFFDLDGKMFCYLWCSSTKGEPYIGFVDGAIIDHPALVQGDRKRMKVFMVDPTKDAPVRSLNEVLACAIKVRRNKAGVVTRKSSVVGKRADRTRRTG